MIEVRWNKMRRAVSLASCVMFSSFWLAFCWPDLWWFGVLMVIYQSQNFWASAKADMADERAEIIAARAGFLSQKLMMGAGIVMYAFSRNGRVGGVKALIPVLFVGMVSEELFRKMLGAEPRVVGGPVRVVGVLVGVCTVGLAVILAWMCWVL